jgi:DNA-binding response OmpR family regulator
VKRLLLIEDHPWVLRVLCDALSRTGAHIESATTLRSARDRIVNDAPHDLIVCEQHLSDGSGLEMLGWLRWQQQISVPFLLITRNHEATAAYDVDFAIINQPFSRRELLACVNRLLQTHVRGLIARQVPFAASLD